MTDRIALMILIREDRSNITPTTFPDHLDCVVGRKKNATGI